LCQRVNGSFEISTEFQSAIGKSRDVLENSLPNALKDVPDKLSIWVTAVAISFLEFQFNSQKDEWELISDKAMKFIRRTLSQHNIDYNIILALAKSIFG